MRTKIEASWVVGNNGKSHTLIRDGVVIYEDNRIIHVGKTFDGDVDQTLDATGKLVCFGFIDTHVHAGHRATHRLITDTGRPFYFGQPFLEISVPKEGQTVRGDRAT
jgi:5-methylthioadenosine/S-adenosylhomocysteine deaminase